MEGRKSDVIRFILLMGFVSLFADLVYESARGVMGPYLGRLGANAFAIGMIFGVGEFLGYVLRVVAGVLVDRTRKYWSFIFVGYGLVASIPLLAFSDYWILAGTLIVMERIGKALRTPARDTIISIYSGGIGSGKAFGIHETVDQAGAIVGSFIFYVILTLGLGYKTGFAILTIPFLLLIASLIIAKLFSSRIHIQKQVEEKVFHNGRKSRKIYFYLLFVLLTSLGFVGFPLIGFHAVKVKVLSEEFIPLFYSIAMLVDALIAIPIGIVYDRFGYRIIVILPILIMLIALLSFSNILILIILGVLVWGITMSFYETVVRAYIGDNVDIRERGTFYGLFNTVVGVGFGIGNSVIGYIYETMGALIVPFIVGLETIALATILITVFTERRS
ncbi:MAG: MFS transporter [Spirochaetia bacterium]|nr:MFS transporter [Spirochaetota bacterium]MDW8112352.1 MFS transporter [Spirochaetia bacterium]